jgi:hypothetical protein
MECHNLQHALEDSLSIQYSSPLIREDTDPPLHDLRLNYQSSKIRQMDRLFHIMMEVINYIDNNMYVNFFFCVEI